jgi:hypothetical protein
VAIHDTEKTKNLARPHELCCDVLTVRGGAGHFDKSGTHNAKEVRLLSMQPDDFGPLCEGHFRLSRQFHEHIVRQRSEQSGFSQHGNVRWLFHNLGHQTEL